jgi:Na+/proline symporter
MAMGGPVGAAIFSMAVFSAAVSTIAGMVMIMATNISRDFVYNLMPKTPPRVLLLLARIFVIPLIIIPLWWTYTSPPPVLSEFMSGSAVAQAGIFFFVIAVSMYWKRATKWVCRRGHSLRHGRGTAPPQFLGDRPCRRSTIGASGPSR